MRPSSAQIFNRLNAGALLGLVLLALGGKLSAADTDYDCTPKIFTGGATYYSWDGSAGDSQLGMASCAYAHQVLPGGTAIGNQLFAAVNTELYAGNLCGACAEVTNNGSGAKVTVMITDECPAASNPLCGTGSNHLDLSLNAYKLANGGSASPGTMSINWKVVPCPNALLNIKGQSGASLSYTFKDGSSSGYAAIIIHDYVMPIKSVEFCTGSGTGCTAATWQTYGVWVPSGSWSNIYLRITDKSGNQGNFGPITCCNPKKSANDGWGQPGANDTSAVYATLPGGQMPACGAASATPTFTRTPTVCVCSPTSTITPTPTPADCPSALNTCDSLSANGGWSGSNATRSIGAFTGMNGSGALQVAVGTTVVGGFNDLIANLSAFAPTDWTQFKRLTVDVFVPTTGKPWSAGGWHNLSLRGTHSSGAGPYQYEVSMGATADLAIDGAGIALPGGTLYRLSFPLAFPGGVMTAASASQVDTVFFCLNQDPIGMSTGTFYLDNIVLHTDTVCPPASPTFSSTRTSTVTGTRTRTPTQTSTPPASSTSTMTMTRTVTQTATDTRTRTATATGTVTAPPATSTNTSTMTPTRTVTATATPSRSTTPSATATHTAPASSATRTSTATPSATATRSITVTSTQTVTPPPGSSFTGTSTLSPVNSFTGTSTPTPTRSRTATSTPSSTQTVVLPTATQTVTPLPGSSFTGTGTRTPTSTISPANSSTRTETALPASTPSFTRTSTVSPSPTESPVLPSFTRTMTPLPGYTDTFTFTQTPSHSVTASFSVTSTRTETPLPGSTFTSTHTAGATPVFTSTFSSTRTITPSNTVTSSSTAVASAVATGTSTFTRTMTPTDTVTTAATAVPVTPLLTATPSTGGVGPNEIEKHGAYPSPWDGTGPLYVAAKLQGHCDKLTLKVYSRSMVCLGTQELGAQAAGWTKIAAPLDFVSGASNGSYFYVVSAERAGQKNLTKAVGKLQVLR